MIRVLHTGDLGDLIAGLPVLRSLGGGSIVISESPYHDRARAPRETMRGVRYEAIRPLLEAQPYVESVEWQDAPAGITHDLSLFRTRQPHPGQNLAEWQAQHMNTDIRLEPWLSVPECWLHGRVVFARSSRYQNPWFPWKELAQHYGDRAMFAGLDSEHQAFEKVIDRRIGRHFTPDLLVLARVIAGASLVICNQSAPFWVAAGLGMPLIQEVWEADANSIVPYKGALYPRGINSKSKAAEFLLNTL